MFAHGFRGTKKFFVVLYVEQLFTQCFKGNSSTIVKIIEGTKLIMRKSNVFYYLIENDKDFWLVLKTV